MALNRGKQFEKLFMEQWHTAFPNSFIYRLKDDISQYKMTAANPCDFICFVKNHLYLLETKTIQGNTFPFSNLSQYDKLLSYSSIDGLVAGVIIWYTERDKVFFVPIQTIKKMKEDGLKSVNVKTALDSYYVLDIPSVKKRVFMDSDYTILTSVLDNKDIERYYELRTI